jgi:hypothetical protein
LQRKIAAEIKVLEARVQESLAAEGVKVRKHVPLIID